MKKGLLHALFVLSVCLVIHVGCDQSSRVAAPDEATTENGYDVGRIVEVLSLSQATVDDSLFLASLPEDIWDEVELYIIEHDVRFFPDSQDNNINSRLLAVSCPWDGSTRRDRGICQSEGYKFQGHHAVYFVVDGPAVCYGKDLDWWVAQCVPTHGCVSGWDLRLSGNWYWNGHKWVKNVALIVPTTWWSAYYWHWPADFKAQRFLLRWNDVNNGCCE